jgi:hypothetical protein
MTYPGSRPSTMRTHAYVCPSVCGVTPRGSGCWRRSASQQRAGALEHGFEHALVDRVACDQLVSDGDLEDLPEAGDRLVVVRRRAAAIASAGTLTGRECQRRAPGGACVRPTGGLQGRSVAPVLHTRTASRVSAAEDPQTSGASLAGQKGCSDASRRAGGKGRSTPPVSCGWATPAGFLTAELDATELV